MDIYFINLDVYDRDKKLIINKIELNKLQHKFAKVYLQKILTEIYNNNSEIIRVNGKPQLKDKSKFFSVSHSKSVVAIAFDDNEIGIDIEFKRERNCEDILKYFGVNPDRKINLDEFFKIWTTYEAEIKSGLAQQVLCFNYENYVCSISAKSTDLINIYEIQVPHKEIFKEGNLIESLEINKPFPVHYELLVPSEIKINKMFN